MPSAPSAAALRISCPSCAAALAIRSELAGRRVKCRCGHAFEAPSLAQLEQAASSAAAQMAMARGYMPAHKRVVTEDANPPPAPNVIVDLCLPLVLIPTGIVLCILQAMYCGKNEASFSAVLAPTLLSIILAIGLMIAAVLGTAISLGMILDGRPWQTGVKIAGIALVPASLGALLGHAVGGMNGDIVSVLAAVGLYTLLVKLILRQTWEHTALIVLACWVIRTFTLYAMYKLQGATSGSWI